MAPSNLMQQSITACIAYKCWVFKLLQHLEVAMQQRPVWSMLAAPIVFGLCRVQAPAAQLGMQSGRCSRQARPQSLNATSTCVKPWPTARQGEKCDS